MREVIQEEGGDTLTKPIQGIAIKGVEEGMNTLKTITEEKFIEGKMIEGMVIEGMVTTAVKENIAEIKAMDQEIEEGPIIGVKVFVAMKEQ